MRLSPFLFLFGLSFLAHSSMVSSQGILEDPELEQAMFHKRTADSGNDENTTEGGNPLTRFLFKYNDVAAVTDVAQLGEVHVDIPRLGIASIETLESNRVLLENNPLIDAVEIDHDVYADGGSMLRGGSEQLDNHRRNLAESEPYGLAMVQADQLGLANPGSNDPIKVCVVDTGYDLDHEDLPSNNVAGYTPPEYLDKNSWKNDVDGHGTHVAGTIGAVGGNNKGVDSVLKDPSKFDFFIGKGLSDAGVGSSSAVLDAVEACVKAGAKVVNLSLGGAGYSRTVENAYRQYFDEGVLFVAAAGNTGNSDDHYPASYKHLMSVAAVDSNENKAGFSTFNDQVEIAGPGSGVVSTVPDDRYASYSGTSMASPHVAAVAALVWSHFPTCSNLQIRNVLLRTAKDKGSNGCDVEYGHGIVQAKDAYDLLVAEGCQAGGATPSPASDGNRGGCSQAAGYTAAPTPAPTPCTGKSNYQVCSADSECCSNNCSSILISRVCLP